MTYLLLSDVHANLGALETVLAHAGKHGWDAVSDPVLFLDDAVGYGCEPNEVLDRLRELRPAVALRGNHEAVLLRLAADPSLRVAPNYEVTKAQVNELSNANREFVEQTTMSHLGGAWGAVHGALRTPWEYLISVPVARANEPRMERPLYAVWSARLSVSRLGFRHFAPPTRALLTGNPSFAAELWPAKGLELTTAHTPPDTFDAWDVAVVESSRLCSEAWLQWLAHADIAGVRVVSALAFNEAVTGRVSTEVLHGRWAPLVLHGRSPYAGTKRALDLAVTLLALPVLLPVAALVALAVLLEGGCPVLSGRNGSVRTADPSGGSSSARCAATWRPRRPPLRRTATCA